MLRTALVAATVALAGGAVWAQAAGSTVTGGTASNAARAAAAVASEGAGGGGSAPGSPTAVTGNPGQSTGARYVESCQQAIERGIVNPGCQGPLYAGEISRLKEDALRTNNPNLLTLLGDAYQSNRSSVSDIGQAYRWYLLGAVRGDPRAMQRLSDLYKNGRGVSQDPVKALGYARLAQRLAVPGSASAQQATEAIGTLGREMATEEVVLADRFASELEQSLRQPPGSAEAVGDTAGNGPAPLASPAPAAASTARVPLTGRLPGFGTAQSGGSVPPPAATALPGSESFSAPARQP